MLIVYTTSVNIPYVIFTRNRFASLIEISLEKFLDISQSSVETYAFSGAIRCRCVLNVLNYKMLACFFRASEKWNFMAIECFMESVMYKLISFCCSCLNAEMSRCPEMMILC